MTKQKEEKLANLAKSFKKGKPSYLCGNSDNDYFCCEEEFFKKEILCRWTQRRKIMQKAFKSFCLIVAIICTTNTIFADYENYDNKDVSGKSFSSSLKYSSWISAIAVETNFNSSDLTSANFTDANLTRANFTDANIDEADLSNAIGFTKEQLYSTTSYKNKYLEYINFSGLNMSGWDFSGQSLMSSTSDSSNLTGANFTDASIYAASFSDAIGFTKEQLYSTASHKNKTLVSIRFSGLNVSGWDFSGQNLTASSFYGTDLTGANFTDANIYLTYLHNAIGFTKEQLYSTASYKNKTLKNINFTNLNMTAWDFSGQDVSNSTFNFSNLSNADLQFSYPSYAYFTSADLRGAYYDASTVERSGSGKNIITTSGIIINLKMNGEIDRILVRAYTPKEGGSAINAKINQNLSTSGGSKIVLEHGNLDIINNASLTIGADSSIDITHSNAEKSLLYVDSGASLTLTTGATLNINVLEDFIPNEGYNFTAISWEDDSQIAGLNELVKDDTITLSLNGTPYAYFWDYAIENNALVITMAAIPEPSTCAMIFAAIAFAFVAYRRKFKN